MRARLLSLVVVGALAGGILFGCAETPSRTTASLDQGSSSSVDASASQDEGQSSAAGVGSDDADDAAYANDGEANAAAGTGTPVATEPREGVSQANEEEGDTVITVRVNGTELRVHPEQNSSSQALVEKLRESPVTMNLSDFGGFEKVGNLPWSLPTNDKQITTKPGDVILYQGDKLTIYYATNTWNFTRLGYIEGVSADELRDILGSDDVVAELSVD